VNTDLTAKFELRPIYGILYYPYVISMILNVPLSLSATSQSIVI